MKRKRYYRYPYSSKIHWYYCYYSFQAEVVKAQFEADMLNLNRDLDKLKKEKAIWEATQIFQGRHQDFGDDSKVLL